MAANIDEIDNVFRAYNIVNVWREKYMVIYNTGNFRDDKERFFFNRLNDDYGHNVNEMVESNCAVK